MPCGAGVGGSERQYSMDSLKRWKQKVKFIAGNTIHPFKMSIYEIKGKWYLWTDCHLQSELLNPNYCRYKTELEEIKAGII